MDRNASRLSPRPPSRYRRPRRESAFLSVEPDVLLFSKSKRMRYLSQGAASMGGESSLDPQSSSRGTDRPKSPFLSSAHFYPSIYHICMSLPPVYGSPIQ